MPLFPALPFAPILRCDVCRNSVVNNLTAISNNGNVLVFTVSHITDKQLTSSTFAHNAVPPGALGAAAVTLYLVTEAPGSTGAGGVAVSNSTFRNNTGATGKEARARGW